MFETWREFRWFVALWLIITQLGGFYLMFIPTVILLTLGAMSLGEAGNPALSGLACLGPILFVTLSGTAWIAFARHWHRQALILTTIVLIIGALTYFAIDLYTRYVNI